MASILRQIVAGPRLQHSETGLDLCYVADNVIATSGPSSNYPKIAYRTPLKQLVNFLDKSHGEDWCIWEFRAEGTGYPDSEVYGRIHHFPFPDHHPPPFALIPKVVASMRNWLQRLEGDSKGEEEEGGKGEEQGQRVAVVHCKAGKGRSGTIACSYLISQEGWKIEDVLQRFTERRMRVGFGSGVSIPSQLRWVRYVDRWTNELGKKYIERPVEILEVHVWGLRDGVKVAVEGFVEDGQKIKQFHLFHRNERIVLPADMSQPNSTGTSDDGNISSNDNASTKNKQKGNSKTQTTTSSATSSPQDPEPLSAESDSSLWTNSLSIPSSSLPSPTPTTPTSQTNPPSQHLGDATITPPKSTPSNPLTQPQTTTAVLLRPQTPLILPTSDINIDFERRSKAASYTGLAMVTSVAHVWFNPYFEGGDKYDSGVFELDWEAMDGIKGTSRKGIKALDRVKVLWRYAEPQPGDETRDGSVENKGRKSSGGDVITEPRPGEPIPETTVTDWRLRETETDTERENGADDTSSSADEGGTTPSTSREQENVPIRAVNVEAGGAVGAEKGARDKDRSA
ncbi:protein-tyrosine phosphatase-like protein [Aspergillus cavernicola]|uniref:phosphatidylinositol-3,4,5-trisphosphate 3-phosphatase n=1 Tax=Aspergillus cavernicola TaxID=176166 RepID=A0ABR4IYV3_9EURO